MERRLALKEAVLKELSSSSLATENETDAAASGNAKPAAEHVASSESSSPSSTSRAAPQMLQWADIHVGGQPQFSRSEAPPPTAEGSHSFSLIVERVDTTRFDGRLDLRNRPLQK